MNRLFANRSNPRAGVSPLVVVVVVIVGVFLIFLVVDYALSPDSVSITGPATIAGGGPANYTVTVTFGDTSSAARTLEVLVYEDDFFNDLLATVLVTIPAGSKTGSALVPLSCTAGALSGASGASDVETTYNVFAIYDRVFPLTNIASVNIPVTCGPAVPPAPVAPPGGTPVTPPGGGAGDEGG